MESAVEMEKATKKQLENAEGEKRRLEKALAAARDEVDST